MNDAFETLIDVPALIRHRDDTGWCIIDCRHDLADPAFGRSAFAQGHIPEALFLSLDDDLSGVRTGRNGRHPLPDPADFAALLGRCGVGNGTQVVAYDDVGGIFAARLWWMLRWLGHRRVAVLDGGLRAWCNNAQPLSAVPRAPVPTTYRPTASGANVDVRFILERLGKPGMTLIDARGPDRFRGENETLDPIGGHIPGALNRFFRENLDTDGRFKPAERLRAEFESLLHGRDAHEVVHQCGSGVTACHNLLAMEHAGLAGSRLYAGSWSEWCADPSRPMSTGLNH